MAKKKRTAAVSKVASKVNPAKVLKRGKKKQDVDEDGTPRITNDTMAEHREEVLSGARRFIHPLQQSRHRIVIISSLIVLLVFGGSLAISGLMLYRFKSTSNFAYRVSQIVPFPVARVNGQFVAYEDYLFEVRNTTFYYRNHGQEGIDIDSDAGAKLVSEVQQQSLEKVILDTLARQIAKENDIVVTDQEIENQIGLIREQGGVGESEEVLEDILRDFYDWDVNDLRRTIRAQLIRQKIPRVLDTDARSLINEAKAALDNGDEFGDVAEALSQDALTAENSGLIGLISRTNTDLPPEFIEATFNAEIGSVTDIVESRFGLHIIFVSKVDGDQREVSHVLAQFFDVDDYLRGQLEDASVSEYISLTE